MLSSKEAENELEMGAQKNPGPWVNHSRSVGLNARLIADKIDDLDSNQAYVMGLLHDIGRREGNKSFMHIVDEYDYLESKQQTDIARICITHSFPIQDINTYFGKFDCTEEQKIFVSNCLNNTVYNDYDRLIQLCDAISLPNGACIMEKRFIDVAMRHGLPDFTISKWKAFLDLKAYFDKLCNCNLYTLLPNVIDNSFGNL